jgi:hypothetical protein
MYLEESAPMWFKPAWGAKVAVEYFVPGTEYGRDTVFYYDMYGPFQELIPQQLTSGYKIIYDAKNEHYLSPGKNWVLPAFEAHPGQGMIIISGHTPKIIPGVSVVATPYWYWILDQTNFVKFGYHTYQSNPTHEHKFFMQLSLQRDDRDQLFQQITPIKHLGLYSYKSQGIHLPNDVDPNIVPGWQRYMNWDWINSCSMTLVVESYLNENAGAALSLTTHDNRFLCEKTYKPIAYGHAFLLAGNQGNLAHVREQGFETFPELWDESYDDLPNYIDRIARLVDIVRDFEPAALTQHTVQQKIAHNRARFFDTQLTDDFFRSTIAEPVVCFVNGSAA